MAADRTQHLARPLSSLRCRGLCRTVLIYPRLVFILFNQMAATRFRPTRLVSAQKYRLSAVFFMLSTTPTLIIAWPSGGTVFAGLTTHCWNQGPLPTRTSTYSFRQSRPIHTAWSLFALTPAGPAAATISVVMLWPAKPLMALRLSAIAFCYKPG